MKQNYKIISLNLTCLFLNFILNHLQTIYIICCFIVCLFFVSVYSAKYTNMFFLSLPQILSLSISLSVQNSHHFISFLPTPSVIRCSNFNRIEHNIEHLNQCPWLPERPKKLIKCELLKKKRREIYSQSSGTDFMFNPLQ